jgi:group I intron endonuclease
MNYKCGIYKITSPSGRIYIGQSRNIGFRMRAYKNKCFNNKQTLLARSLKKYGFDKHKVEILKECTQEELNHYEILYIRMYNSFDSKIGLNLKSGGHYGGSCSEEVRKKLRTPKSEATKQKLREAATGRKYGEKTKSKHRKRMIGNKYLLGKKVCLGRTHSEETKAVIKTKRANQIMPSGYKRPKFSKQWIENMRKSHLGKKHNEKFKERMSGQNNPMSRSSIKKRKILQQ